MNRENNADRGTEAGEKMIFIILLLLFLTPCVSGPFVVNVTQTSYQAEENQDITLEWTFSTRRDTSLSSISTLCQLFTEIRTYVLFHLHQGVESPESQDPQFAGRVQWDKDVLTEGRLTLHVSRLRTNDSGFYVCDILVRPEGSNSRRCWLSVTAAAELQTQRPTESPQPERERPTESPPESWRNFWIYVGLPANTGQLWILRLWGFNTSMEMKQDVHSRVMFWFSA
ncbi:hypothetical protein NQZ68_018057 [Dissostichus eleginoides]|nr:hypothetical protein NQZ68_018057 [Dissostichus eleginoides]